MKAKSVFRSLTLKQPTNNHDPHRQQFLGVSTTQNKNDIGNDGVSVIEEVGDSFISGDDLLKQFEQYGIQISNVQMQESDDQKLRVGLSRFSNDNQTQKKNAQFETVLDYSNMAKIKQKDFCHQRSKVSRIQTKNKIRQVDQEVKNMKKSLIYEKQSIIKVMKQFMKQVENTVHMLYSKNCHITEKYKKQKQAIEYKYGELKIHVAQLKQKNCSLEEQIQKLRESKIQSKIDKTDVNSFVTDKRIDSFQRNRRIQHQLQLQYQKQSNLMKILNKEIEELTQQLQGTKKQNKKLKAKLKQNQTKQGQFVNKQKTEQSQQTQKHIQTYNKFLQKINELQSEINELKKKQSLEKQKRIQEWKIQIKDQLEQIQQFLSVCEEKEKQLEIRESQIERREMDRKTSWENRRKKSPQIDWQHHDIIQEKSSRQRLSSPKKGSMNEIQWKPRFSTQLSSYNSQKFVKMSPILQMYSSKRISEGGQYNHERANSGNLMTYRSNMKHMTPVIFNQQLSSRLNRISNCIESQLIALSYNR